MAEILLVEDEESVNRGIEFTLTKEGYEVENAGSIREAEELLRRRSRQLVICDVNLPDGSGLDLIREIRKSSMVHIICLTALDAGSEAMVQAVAEAEKQLFEKGVVTPNIPDWHDQNMLQRLKQLANR